MVKNEQFDRSCADENKNKNPKVKNFWLYIFSGCFVVGEC